MVANIQNQTQLITFAKQMVNEAAKRNLDLRIFGGIAVRIHCAIQANPSENPALRDIDFIAKIEQLNQVNEFLQLIKFTLTDNPEFSGHGEHRIYEASQDDYGSAVKLDVYFGRLSFNHTIPHPYFGTHDKYTIPITQLLIKTCNCATHSKRYD